MIKETTIASKEISHFPFPGKRHFQYALWFFLGILAYGMRSNLSVGILAMMSDDPPSDNIPTYPNWTMKNTMLSSFFWGYIIPQIVAGKVAQRFGSKWPLAYSLFVNSLFCILTPNFANNFGQNGVIICRIIQGFHQGFIFPSLHTLTEKWSPLSERSRVVSFVYTGTSLGVFISILVTGQVSHNIGWTYAFYLYGTFGMLWVIFWIIFGKNEPTEHKSITNKELLYIKGNNISNNNKEADDDNDEYHNKFISTPWKDIFTSKAFWAIIIAHSGFTWGYWVLLTETPSYLKHIMKYDLNKSSILAAAPYLLLWILNFLFAPIADMLINKKIFSIGTTRKLFNTLGFIPSALLLIWIAFEDSSNKNFVVILIILCVGINAAGYSGFNCNHIDIAPVHSGILMGITNSLSNILSIIAPLSLNIINLDETDPALWQIVFCFAAIIYIISDVIFVLCASGEIQFWNIKQNKNQDIETPTTIN